MKPSPSPSQTIALAARARRQAQPACRISGFVPTILITFGFARTPRGEISAILIYSRRPLPHQLPRLDGPVNEQ